MTLELAAHGAVHHLVLELIPIGPDHRLVRVGEAFGGRQLLRLGDFRTQVGIGEFLRLITYGRMDPRGERRGRINSWLDLDDPERSLHRDDIADVGQAEPRHLLNQSTFFMR